MRLTIDQGLQIVIFLLFLGFVIAFWLGWRQIKSAGRLQYYLLRHVRVTHGWRLILVGIVLGLIGLTVRLKGREVAYLVIPPTPSVTPTPTITLTPTITMTPTISPTPTITSTPTITPTPTITATPMLPEGITVLFQETVTPNPKAAFSPIEVATRIDAINNAIRPADTFNNPINTLYGAFSYDHFSDGARWTAIWYMGEDEIVCLETKPWDGGTGGYGYTECTPEKWMPGEYEIRMFMGEVWKVSTRFKVVGLPPAPTSTSTPTITPSMTPSMTPSPTRSSTPSG